MVAALKNPLTNCCGMGGKKFYNDSVAFFSLGACLIRSCSSCHIRLGKVYIDCSFKRVV